MSDVIDSIEEAAKVLPARFVPRMMGDEWFFGLFMSDGSVLGISGIDEIHRDASGQLWLDVRMLDGLVVLHGNGAPLNLRLAPTSRLNASVAVRHIMYAIELADT